MADELDTPPPPHTSLNPDTVSTILFRVNFLDSRLLVHLFKDPMNIIIVMRIYSFVGRSQSSGLSFCPGKQTNKILMCQVASTIIASFKL